MMVADAGPIIAFARIDRLDLLHHVASELWIPEAVYEEVTTKGRGRAGAIEVEQLPWINKQAVIDPASLAKLPPTLHSGEREAIVLAQELGTQLLIDERRGRAVARAQGIEVLGSLRILADAKQSGLIVEVKPLLEALFAAEYRMDEDLIRLFLKEIGEADQ